MTILIITKKFKPSIITITNNAKNDIETRDVDTKLLSTPSDVFKRYMATTNSVVQSNNLKMFMWNMRSNSYCEYTVTKDMELTRTNCSEERTLNGPEYWSFEDQQWKIKQSNDNSITVNNTRQIILPKKFDPKTNSRFSFIQLQNLFYSNKDKILTLKQVEHFPLQPTNNQIVPWTFARYILYLGIHNNKNDEIIDPSTTTMNHSSHIFRYDGLHHEWLLERCETKKCKNFATQRSNKEEPHKIYRPKLFLSPILSTNNSVAHRDALLERKTLIFGLGSFETRVWLLPTEKSCSLHSLGICGYPNIIDSLILHVEDDHHGHIEQTLTKDSFASGLDRLHNINNPFEYLYHDGNNKYAVYTLKSRFILIKNKAFGMNPILETFFKSLEDIKIIFGNQPVKPENTPDYLLVQSDINLPHIRVMLKRGINLLCYIGMVGNVVIDMYIPKSLDLRIEKPLFNDYSKNSNFPNTSTIITEKFYNENLFSLNNEYVYYSTETIYTQTEFF